MHSHGRTVRRRLSVERLEKRHLLAAAAMPGITSVLSVEPPAVAGWITPSSAQWRGAGSSQVDFAHQSLGLTGQGQTVAVIDTGIAYDHIALGGGFGSSQRVVGGWDFAESDPDPYDDAPAGFHGTHVAGIIGSDHEVYTGVAPGVDLVALRVFDDRGAGTFTSVESALRWVHQYRDAFAHPITTVNLSLGSEWNADVVPAWGGLEDELAQLERDGIFTAVAAGNSFPDYRTAGLSYPAASPHVVPVASLGASGQVSTFSQRNERALVAPGELVTSTAPDYLYDFNGVTDDFVSASGTSMAAPFVAGASVLLREALQLSGHENVGQQELREHLQRYADLVYDSATGASYRAINLERALLSALPADKFADHPQSAHDLGTLGGNLEVGGMINTLNDRDFFRFTATQSGIARLAIDPSGYLQPVWNTPGSTGFSTDTNPEFHVTAGQTYVIGLGTAGGIGGYDARLSLDVGTAELGTVDATTIDTSNASRVYTWTAAHTGWLTVTTTPASTDDSSSLQLMDATGRELARVDLHDGPARMQIDAVAGQQYQLRVTAGPVPAEISLTNLVAVDGQQILVYATAGNDRFVVRQVAGGTRVTVHGDTYDLRPRQVADVRIVGGNLADEILIFGSQESESAYIDRGFARLDSPAAQVRVSGLDRILMFGGGGNDELTLYGTNGPDQLAVTPDYVMLSATGGTRHVGREFASVRAVSTPGQDVAVLYDSPLGDRLTLTADSARLVYPGATIWADGFESVFAMAGSGGTDAVEIVGSSYDDRVVFRPEMVVVETPVANQIAKGFDTVTVSSEQGGHDTLIAFDSYGNDRLQVSPESIELFAGEVTLHAMGFESSAVLASRGGVDVAHFVDSPGDDVFVGDGDLAMLTGGDFRHVARGFAERMAASQRGGFDTARLYASVTGLDEVQQSAHQTSLLGAESATSVHGFADVVVVGQTREGTGDGIGEGQGDGRPGTSMAFAARPTGGYRPSVAARWTTPRNESADNEVQPGDSPFRQNIDAAPQKLAAVDNYHRQIRSRHHVDAEKACAERLLIDPAAEFRSIDALFARSAPEPRQT